MKLRDKTEFGDYDEPIMVWAIDGRGSRKTNITIMSFGV